MKIEYLRTAKKSFMIVKEADYSFENYELQMILQNEIPCLLEMQIIMGDGKVEYWYDVTGMLSLEKQFSLEEINEKTLRFVLQNLIEMKHVMEEYLLDDRNLCLTSSMIFYDRFERRLRFCYIPGFGGENCGDVKDLFTDILENLNHLDPAAVKIGYDMYDRCMKSDFLVEDARECLRGRSANAAAPADPDELRETSENRYRAGSGEEQGLCAGRNREGSQESGISRNRGGLRESAVGRNREGLRESAVGRNREGLRGSAAGRNREGLRESAVGRNWEELQESAPDRNREELRESMAGLRYDGTRGESARQRFEDKRGTLSDWEKQYQEVEDGIGSYAAEGSVHPAKEKRWRENMRFNTQTNEWEERAAPDEQPRGRAELSGTVDSVPPSSLNGKEKKKAGWRMRKKERKQEAVDYGRLLETEQKPVFVAEPDPEPEYTECFSAGNRKDVWELLYKGDGVEQDIPLTSFPFFVGTSAGKVQGLLHARTVSRVHARFSLSEGKLFVEDYNSTNGTYVNQKILPLNTPQELHAGDQIVFATEEYLVCCRKENLEFRRSIC